MATPPAWNRKKDDKTLLELHAQGHSQTKVAKLMGKSRTLVAKQSVRLGLGWNLMEQTKKAVLIRSERAEQARAERLERDGVIADLIQEKVFELLEVLDNPEAIFYLKGRGGEMTPTPATDSTPLPPEFYETLLKTINELRVGQARIDALHVSADGVSEITDYLLSNVADKVANLQPNPAALEENKEAPPEAKE